MFCLLYRRGRATHAELIDTLYGDDHVDWPEDPERAVRDVVKRMRRRTRPMGVDVRSEYGIGYEMSGEQRALARRLLYGDQ